MVVEEHVWDKPTKEGIKVLQILSELSVNIFRDKLHRLYMNLPRELGLRMEIAFWNMISQYIKKLYLDGA